MTPSRTNTARFKVPLILDASLLRPRIMQTLDDQQSPIVLVTGPPGAGKTTAVAGWAGTIDAVAWIRLDDRDDDITAFWSVVLEGLRLAGIGQEALSELQAPPRDAARSFVDAMVHALDTAGPLTLVLDDVHHLHSPELLASLAGFAQDLPPGKRLILISRTQPDIRQHRLRLEGRFREVGFDSLSLTPDETRAFLKAQGLDVSDEISDTLHDRTQGWIAGVRLAAMSMSSGREPQPLVAGTGQNEAVADYLVGEVLSGLPEDLREFLNSTCVCNQLTAGLARELTGDPRSTQVLEELAGRSLFTVRLDAGGEQYRYHDLLRTHLIEALGRSDPARLRDLHRTTAAWCLQHDEPVHAMEHFALAEDVEALNELARTWGITAMLDGHSNRLLRLIARMNPRTAHAEHLWLLAAACAMETDDLRTADAYLHRVPGPVPDDPLTAILAATVAVARARYTKDVGPALADLEARWQGRSGSPDLDLYAMHQKGVACLYLGRYADGNESLGGAERIADATGREVLRLSCLSFLAGSAASTNDYTGMRRYAQVALEAADRLGWSQSQVAAHTHMIMSWSCHLRSEPDDALEHAELACAALGGYSEPDVELTAHTSRVLAKETLNTLTIDDMRSTIADLRRLADATMSPAVMSNIGPQVVRICLNMGERAWAREVAAMTLQSVPDPGEPMLIKAMLLQDSGQPVHARRALEAIVSGQAPCHVSMNLLTALLLAAVQDAQEQRNPRSHRLLTEALRLGADSDISQPFTSRPEVIALLVSGEGRFGRLDDFARRIVNLSGPGRVGPARLTPSELAVLRELPSLWTIREIADHRQVSINTLKAQIRSVYRKLGVSGRREAVETARGLNLL